ncbi:MAG: hypothetical protein HY925_05120 [Elusimicrobia bacterium]|nr:hypothetical protein [Elusimicrobiota bacterium]
MKKLAARLGWAPITAVFWASMVLPVGAFREWFPVPAIWFFHPVLWTLTWYFGGHAWRGWVEAAWKPGRDMRGVDRGCWLMAMSHVWLAEILRWNEIPGWAFLHVSAAVLVVTGAHVQRPRPDRQSLPKSAFPLFAIALGGWAAQGAALGLAAESPRAGLFLGVLFAFCAMMLLGSVSAMAGAVGKNTNVKAQDDTLRGDLALLWKTAFPISEEAPLEPAPLASYAFDADSAAPKAAAAAPESAASSVGAVNAPTLVESGGFRVDADKAIEKLSRFRSADPRDFVLALFRSAVASRASNIRVERAGDWFRLTFDGSPLDSAAVSDPLGMLLTSDLAAPERELATGILGALALLDCRMTVTSGVGAKRRRLRVAPKGTPFEPPTDPGRDTVIDVRCWTPAQYEQWTKTLEGGVGLVDVKWAIGLKPGACRPPKLAAVDWWAPDGRETELLVGPRRDLDHASRIQFFKYGTKVSEEIGSFADVPIEACVRDDAFTLDVSQSKVVRDARYKAALKEVKKAGGGFSKWLNRKHHERRSPSRPGLWRLVRIGLGFPAKIDVDRDEWDRTVKQWLEAQR